MNMFCAEGSEQLVMCRECPNHVCPFVTLDGLCYHARLAALFDNKMTCIFAVVVSVWAVTFLENYKRYRSELIVRWETRPFDYVESLVRPQYEMRVKSKRVSPVTGTEEPYLSTKEKRRRIVLSGMAMAAIISVLITFIIATIVYRITAVVLFYQSGVEPSHIVSPSVAASVTGAIANLVLIQFMSLVYPKISLRMTEYELPRTEEEFQASYAYKLACFQFINFYGSLIYLAFVRRPAYESPNNRGLFDARCPLTGCLEDLTIQLILIMTLKQVIQNGSEIIIPKFKKYYRFRTNNSGNVDRRKRWEKDASLIQGHKPSEFNDMLEMIIQYGFITMFSPAFPIAALFAVINNLFEIRIDAQKYLKDLPRLMPESIMDSGPWLDILEVTTKVSVFLNACIIAFTSLTLDEMYFLFEVSPTVPGNYTYREFFFTKFNISHYPTHLQNVEADVNFHTDTCLILGNFEEEDGRLVLSSHHWRLTLMRFAFVVVFENGIFLLQSIVGRIIRHHASDRAKTRQLREIHVAKERLKSEQQKAWNQQPSYPANLTDQDDAPPNKREQAKSAHAIDGTSNSEINRRNGKHGERARQRLPASMLENRSDTNKPLDVSLVDEFQGSSETMSDRRTTGSMSRRAAVRKKPSHAELTSLCETETDVYE